MPWRCLWETKSGADQKRCRKQCDTCAFYDEPELIVAEEKEPMNFDSYLDQARETAIYKHETALEYLALGLASEAGEIAGHIKKLVRDDVLYNGVVALELGDVLWYLAMLADELGYSLAEIAEKNVAKLRDRQERGQLQGSGDQR